MLEVELEIILALLTHYHILLSRMLITIDHMLLIMNTSLNLFTFKVVRVLLILNSERDFKVEINI